MNFQFDIEICLIIRIVITIFHHHYMQLLIFLPLVFSIIFPNTLTHALTLPQWPTYSLTSISENSIELTSKFEFSFQRSQYGNKIHQANIQTFNNKLNTKSLHIEVDVGVVRMFAKNNQLRIYQGNHIRVLPQIHRLDPSHDTKQRVQVQTIYRLAFGNKAEYDQIGISWFVEPSDHQVAQEYADQFANDLLKIFGYNITEGKPRNTIFDLHQYFPVPQQQYIQNMYVFRIKEYAGLLWGIRRSPLKIPTADFNQLKNILDLGNGEQQKLEQGSNIMKVYAAKVRPSKTKQAKQAKQKQSKSECDSQEQKHENDEL